MKFVISLMAALCLIAVTASHATDVLTTNDSPASIAGYLKQMSSEQRENAQISFVLHSPADEAARELKERVEMLWNSGEYDAAIKLAAGLASLCGGQEPQVAVTYREPEISGGAGRWISDVRIGTRDMGYCVDMAVDPVAGHIFCGVLNQYSSYYEMRVFMSADGGSTWSSPGNFSSALMYRDISLTVAGSYCYFAYNGTDQVAELQRRTVADNATATFPGGEIAVTAAYIDPPQTLGEIELRSAYELGQGGLDLILAVGVSGPAALKMYRGTNGGADWSIASTQNLGGSSIRGLDMCVCENYSVGYPYYVCFMDESALLRVGFLDGYLRWHQLTSAYAGYNGRYTSIGAYGDYVYSAFEYHDYLHTGRIWCQRGISIDGGFNWNWAALSGDESQDTYAPDVALAGNGGQAAVYSRDMFMVQRIYTFWQSYGETGLPYTVEFAGGEPSADKPDIENLGGGEYGIVYIRYDRPLGGVYFDRGSECCQGIRGDIDGSGAINVADLTYLVAYIFKGGDWPPCMDEADVDGSGAVNVSDLTYVVANLFKNGPEPVACD